MGHTVALMDEKHNLRWVITPILNLDFAIPYNMGAEKTP